jgi:hypothetical protein
LIDFRYHVVSIVAVFLALTVGLVIGSSYLSKVAYDGLNGQLSSLRGQNQALHSTQTELNAQIRDRDSLIVALGSDAIKGKLAGRSVAVIALPGADRSVADAAAEMLVKAGAEVPGELYVKPGLVDPNQASKLLAVSVNVTGLRVSEGDVSPSQSPSQVSAPARAFSDLAAAVIRKSPAATDGTGTTPLRLSDSEAASILADYSNGGYVDLKSTFATAADMVVIVGPQPGQEPTAGADNALYLGLAKDLDPAKGTVIVGPTAAAAAPGLIAAAVKDSWTAKNVSTVDSIDLAAGRIITVFALAEELAGSTGHYGLTGTADGPLPILH